MTVSAAMIVVRGPVYHPSSTGSGGPWDLTSTLVVVEMLVAAGLFYVFVVRPANKPGRKRRSKR